mgnify:CR=1 FL=1
MRLLQLYSISKEVSVEFVSWKWKNRKFRSCINKRWTTEKRHEDVWYTNEKGPLVRSIRERRKKKEKEKKKLYIFLNAAYSTFLNLCSRFVTSYYICRPKLYYVRAYWRAIVFWIIPIYFQSPTTRHEQQARFFQNLYKKKIFGHFYSQNLCARKRKWLQTNNNRAWRSANKSYFTPRR